MHITEMEQLIKSRKKRANDDHYIQIKLNDIINS